MLKDHRHVCTGSACKVCRHLGRQRAARAMKRAGGPPPAAAPGPATAGTPPPAGDPGNAH